MINMVKEYNNDYEDPLDMLSIDKSVLYLNDKKYILNESDINDRRKRNKKT